MPVFSFLALQVSPNSNTIFPNRMPLAYMFGIVITYSNNETVQVGVRHSQDTSTHRRPRAFPLKILYSLPPSQSTHYFQGTCS